MPLMGFGSAENQFNRGILRESDQGYHIGLEQGGYGGPSIALARRRQIEAFRTGRAYQLGEARG
jgi:hypothetical protein